MRARGLLAALAAALLWISLPSAQAADGATPPNRVIDERPFGGPPPQHRSLEPKPWGTTCKTPSIACTLAKSQQVGSACSCPGSDAGSDGRGIAGVTEASQ